MKRSSVSLVLSLVLVFASGVVVGALGHRSLAAKPAHKTDNHPRTPEEFRRGYVNEMKSRLKLSDPQVAKLETILDDTRQKMHDFREHHRPEMTAIMDNQTAQISAMLDAAQRAEYQKMRDERDARRKADEAKSGPRGK